MTASSACLIEEEQKEENKINESRQEEKEEEEDEEEEEEDQLSELANFKKLSICKTNRIPIKIIAEPLEEITELKIGKQADSSRSNQNIRIVNESNERRQKNLKKNSNALNFLPRDVINQGSQANSLNEEDEEERSYAPRIDRFLSVVELPPEILLYTQQLSESAAKREADKQSKRSKSILGSKSNNRRKANSASKSANSTDKEDGQKEKEKGKVLAYQRSVIRHYHNGSGLSQAAKREIIKTIIKNFDMPKYLHEFQRSQIVEVKYDKTKAETRSIRNRLIGFMNTDKIRINDKQFMSELSNKIQNAYKERLYKRMEYLEEQERKRERKLQIKGLIIQNNGNKNEDETSYRLKNFKNMHSNYESSTIRKLSNLYRPDEFALNNTPYRLSKLK